MKEIEYQQKMCASAGQIPPLQEQTAKAGKQRGLVLFYSIKGWGSLILNKA